MRAKSFRITIREINLAGALEVGSISLDELVWRDIFHRFSCRHCSSCASDPSSPPSAAAAALLWSIRDGIERNKDKRN